jgi:hypothetical protein
MLQSFQLPPSSSFLSLLHFQIFLMALAIVEKPTSNFLFLFSVLLLALLCTPSNSQAFVLGMPEPIDRA